MRHLHLKVVGIAHHLDAARAVFQPILPPELMAGLRREADNAYDKNAVQVHVNGHHVGYIDKDHSHLVTKLIERQRIHEIKCSGKVRSEKADRPWFFLDISHEPLTPGKRASAVLAEQYRQAITAADDIAALTAVASEIKTRHNDLRPADIDALRMAYRVRVGQMGGH